MSESTRYMLLWGSFIFSGIQALGVSLVFFNINWATSAPFLGARVKVAAKSNHRIPILITGCLVSAGAGFFLLLYSSHPLRLAALLSVFFALIVITWRQPKLLSFPVHSDEQSNLLALRPRIVPVSYGRSTSDGRYGLSIENFGEPAFDVSVPDIVMVGTCKLIFFRDFPSLTKAQGKVLLEAYIETRPHNTAFGDLFEYMRSQAIAAVEFPIRYKDGDNQFYTTHCKIERDVLAPGGLAVRFVRQVPGNDSSLEKQQSPAILGKAELLLVRLAPDFQITSVDWSGYTVNLGVFVYMTVAIADIPRTVRSFSLELTAPDGTLYSASSERDVGEYIRRYPQWESGPHGRIVKIKHEPIDDLMTKLRTPILPQTHREGWIRFELKNVKNGHEPQPGAGLHLYTIDAVGTRHAVDAEQLIIKELKDEEWIEPK